MVSLQLNILSTKLCACMFMFAHIYVCDSILHIPENNQIMEQSMRHSFVPLRNTCGHHSFLQHKRTIDNIHYVPVALKKHKLCV